MGHRRQEFIARREHLGITQEQLAFRTEAAVATVSAWERGLRTPKATFRPVLAKVLQVSLIDLDRLLGIEPPIALNGHRVATWLNHYQSLVLAAGRVCVFWRSAVHGLLQTRAYATAVEQLGADNQVAEKVDARLARQSVLHRDADPLELVAVLHEATLYDALGGPEVMVEQLDHLVAMAERPNIELRLLPANGQGIVCPGEFELLVKPGDPEPFMAVTTDPGGPDYHERDVDVFIAMFAHLRATALGATDSLDLIKRARKTYNRARETYR